MKTKAGFLAKILLVGVVAFAAMPHTSFAQSGMLVRGSIDLPFQAQWNTVTLQPGNYSFTVTAQAGLYFIALHQGKRAVGFVMAQQFSNDAASPSTSELVCVRQETSCAVSILRMPAFGILKFGTLVTGRQAEHEAHITERVPVLLAEN